MEKKFEIGQRVKILGHKGTCFENATGTIVDEWENVYKIKFDKSDELSEKLALWFSKLFIEAIEDE